jgi:hypothetical protein
VLRRCGPRACRRPGRPWSNIHAVRSALLSRSRRCLGPRAVARTSRTPQNLAVCSGNLVVCSEPARVQDPCSDGGHVRLFGGGLLPSREVRSSLPRESRFGLFSCRVWRRASACRPSARSEPAAGNCSNKRAIQRSRMRAFAAGQAGTTLNEARSATLQATG